MAFRMRKGRTGVAHAAQGYPPRERGAVSCHGNAAIIRLRDLLGKSKGDRWLCPGPCRFGRPGPTVLALRRRRAPAGQRRATVSRPAARNPATAKRTITPKLRPIETAPLDGSVVLIAHRDGEAPAYWNRMFRGWMPEHGPRVLLQEVRGWRPG